MAQAEPKELQEAQIHIPEPTAESLAHLRELAGMTQAELAKAVKVNRVTAARWEVDGATMTPKVEEAVVKLSARIADRILGKDFQATERLNKKMAKRDPAKSKVIAEITANIDTRVWLLTSVLIGEEATEMPSDYWEALFGLRSSVLDDTPKRRVAGGGVLLTGFDVGVSIDAAARGMTYAERRDQLGGIRSEFYDEFGRFRLVNELELVTEELQGVASQLPTTENTWINFEPFIANLDS